jgi:hypothetical protein
MYNNLLYMYKNVYANIVHGDVNLMLQYIAFGEQGHFLPVFRIFDILVWIRIRGAMPPNLDLDPDPTAIFVIDLQDASKKLIFLAQFFLLVNF